MSKLITKNDLKAIFDEILPYQKRPWFDFYKSNFTGNNTGTTLTGITINTNDVAEDCFTVGTDQVTIKKAGNYKITITFRLSAITTQANVKRITLMTNSVESVIAMARLSNWEDCSRTDIRTFAVGDVITVSRRFEDGNSTCEQMRCIVEYID